VWQIIKYPPEFNYVIAVRLNYGADLPCSLNCGVTFKVVLMQQQRHWYS